jgi:hypothetical protein
LDVLARSEHSFSTRTSLSHISFRPLLQQPIARKLVKLFEVVHTLMNLISLLMAEI